MGSELVWHELQVPSSPLSNHSSGNSSPLNSSPSSQSHNNKKKRKFNDENIADVCAWGGYIHGPALYPVHDAINFQYMSNNMDLIVRNVNPNCAYSDSHEAWICYRQNQFKIVCTYLGPELASLCVNDGGMPMKIEEMQVKIYAVKEVAGILADSIRVGLHYIGKRRLKSDKQEIEIAPLINGKVEFSNLLFEKSNAAKTGQPQTEYFHIVAVLYAKCGGNLFPVLSKMSSKIIVRAQNPGFYKEETADAPKAASDSSFTFIETSSGDSSPSTLSPQSLSPSVTPFYNFTSTTTTSTTTFSTPISATINNDSPSDIPELSYPVPTFTLTSASQDSIPIFSSTFPLTSDPMDELESCLEEMSKKVIDPKEKEANGWSFQSPEIVYHHGRVGINTSTPTEALTVHGNALVTGDVLKPSDRRIKSQIEPVDNRNQLSHIRQLKIYDYIVNGRQERGVIAQELQTVMPASVKCMGDVELNSVVVPNFLVVNERTLLYENIGATKQLDNDLKSEKAHVVEVESKIEEITEETNTKTTEVKGYMQTMLDKIFIEESHRKTVYAGIEEEFVNFQFSVFRMGPARSLFILGMLADWFWVIGCVFIFSNVMKRKFLGFMCLLCLALNAFLDYFNSLGAGLWMPYFTQIYLFNALLRLGYAIAVLRVNKNRLERTIKHPDSFPPPPTSRWGRFRDAMYSYAFF